MTTDERREYMAQYRSERKTQERNAAQAVIGETVRFRPTVFMRPSEQGQTPGIEYELTGRVTYVNAAHRYFAVEAPCHGYTIRECFKF